MNRGDIWVVDLSPTRGREQPGKHPVLVLSRAEFNQVTGIALIAPITTMGLQSRTAGFAVSLLGFGLKTGGVVRSEQIRALDVRDRQGWYAERAPDEIVEQVLAKIATVLE